jgi:hypothetical protein
MIPLFPETNRGGLAAMMSGSKSQLVEPGVSHWQPVALVVVHCAREMVGSNANNVMESKYLSIYEGSFV